MREAIWAIGAAQGPSSAFFDCTCKGGGVSRTCSTMPCQALVETGCWMPCSAAHSREQPGGAALA